MRLSERARFVSHWSQQRRLGTVLGLNLALIAGLVIAGLISHSVSVLAAAGDTAADAVGLILGLIAVTIRDRSDTTAGEDVTGGSTVLDRRKSRITTLVAILNGAMLLVVTGIIVAESINRLVAGAPQVVGLPMLIVSVISAAVLLLGAAVLGRSAADEDLHMRSVLLDTLADAGSALAVAAAGAVIMATGRLFWLDSVLAIVIGVIVAIGAIKLLRDGIRVLRGEDVDFDDD